MTKIKFCGLTRPFDAAFASALGASYVGVIFAASPRQLSPDEGRVVLDFAGVSVQRVGVFGPASLEEVTAIARIANLDVVQLHGTHDAAFVEKLRKTFGGKVWSVVGVTESGHTTSGLSEPSRYADAIVLDTVTTKKAGGTGRVFDWDRVAGAVQEAATRVPVVIAGGLNPENVGVAISTLHPSIVDVSSGVESSPGIKDHNLMQAFAEAVHSASIV